MRTLLLLSVTLSSWLTSEVFSQPKSPPDWQLVWSDEFKGSGPIDQSKWGYELGYVRNDEAQYYTTDLENARRENNWLIIEAKNDESGQHQFTSASLTTQNKFDFLYGRVEMRAKLPKQLGCWPALWTLGVNIYEVGWPLCGEIDIMEHITSEPMTVYSNVHYENESGYHDSEALSTYQNKLHKPHIYAMEWDPTEIRFYLDGEIYHRVSLENSDRAAFHAPHFLIANLALGSWAGEVDHESLPAQYKIDYIRVYQDANLEVNPTPHPDESCVISALPEAITPLAPHSAIVNYSTSQTGYFNLHFFTKHGDWLGGGSQPITAGLSNSIEVPIELFTDYSGSYYTDCWISEEDGDWENASAWAERRYGRINKFDGVTESIDGGPQDSKIIDGEPLPIAYVITSGSSRDLFVRIKKSGVKKTVRKKLFKELEQNAAVIDELDLTDLEPGIYEIEAQLRLTKSQHKAAETGTKRLVAKSFTRTFVILP